MRLYDSFGIVGRPVLQDEFSIRLTFPRSSLLLHPAVIALLTWCVVGSLYVLHLSRRLLYTSDEVLNAVSLIAVPIFIVSLIHALLTTSLRHRRGRFVVHAEAPLDLIRRRMRKALLLWIALAVLETIVSGGVPLVWVITGSSKTYFDYGIPSLHGLVNALMSALAVGYWGLYLCTGHRPFLRFPIFVMFWTVVLITRGTLMVLLLQLVILLLRLRPIKTAVLVRLLAGGLIVLLLFGVVGDLRTGADFFKELAEPTPAFPDWAPSGVLWAYIYMTTPLNNLLLTMHSRKPDYSVLFPATAATLFPTVLRNLIYGEENARKTQQGELESQSLTVSTAYVGPFQDMGAYGIVLFSVLAGVLCEIYWHRTGFLNIFVFTVFAQALVLTLFYNLLFSLPILGQLVWFYYFTRKPRRTRAASLRPSLEKLAVHPIHGY